MNAQITLENSHLMVSGDLNFSTVMMLLEQSMPLFSKCNELKFDLSRVNSSNSAGLALLLEWIRHAKKIAKPISFSHLPLQFVSMMQAAGVEKMLGSYQI